MYVHYERTLLAQRSVNGKKLSVAAGSRVKLSRWCTLNDTVTSTPIIRKTDHFGRGQRPDALKHSPREDDVQERASSAERKLISRHPWRVTVSCTCRVDHNLHTNCNVRFTTYTYLFHLVVTCSNNTNHRTFAHFKAHEP